jgi:hypothetical protein
MERTRNDRRQPAGPLTGAPERIRRAFWPVPGGRPAVLTPRRPPAPIPDPPPRDVVPSGKAQDLDPMTKG